MRLYEALGIGPGEIVAFVGSGGKSSAITLLCEEISGSGMSVLAVPTTKMFVSETNRIGPLVTSSDAGELRSLVENGLGGSSPGERGAVLVAGGGLLSKDRVAGVEQDQITGLAGLADVTLVESDGSRRRPLKGTAPHEPAIPTATTLCVAVGGSWALGRPLDESSVHRPEIFSELTGIAPGQEITAGAFATALAEGSLGKVAEGARRAALITGAGLGSLETEAVAQELRRLGVRNVVLLTSPPLQSPPGARKAGMYIREA